MHGKVFGPAGIDKQNSEDTRPDDGDIVVTAQRVSSLASKTPIALGAVSGQELSESGVTNPLRLEEQTLSLSIVRNNGLQITIRGVSSSDNTAKGDPAAAFLVTGIYIARPQAQEISFYDVERVEILRGPQGTLYGRNSTAGVINVITKKPGDTFEMSADVTIGTYDTRQGRGAVNFPVSDFLAVRFAGSYDYRDSYFIQNVGQKRDIGPFKDNRSVRAQALFTLSHDLTVLLRTDYSAIKGNDFGSRLRDDAFYAPLPAGAPSYTDPLYTGSSASSSTLRRVNFAVPSDFRTDNLDRASMEN
ncbi:TonB-dependent receptor plug domain-containing protein [Sphingobium sp. HWE2-09]|uniref:TonB-dependent receptor plug domain-containing protein n=1 Tax=Sphingobium sp. HWE2-09 TaxID=3108390 RepID=UPI002DC73431|nr:TonB-dependent receptor plug domain-containing protein [Sphingobium sp. HWE2-09]